MACGGCGRPECRNVGRRVGRQRGRTGGRKERRDKEEGRKEGRKEGMMLLAVGDVAIDWRWWAPPAIHYNERLSLRNIF